MNTGAYVGNILDFLINLSVMILFFVYYFNEKIRKKYGFVSEKYKWIYLLGALSLFLTAFNLLSRLI